MESLQAVLSRPRLEIEKYDTAILNLFAACGLPGAEELDVDWHLAKLDEIAKHVANETNRHYAKFENNLAAYGYSQGYFCMLTLMTVLYEDCNLRYNPERIRDPKFQDPYCIDPDFSDSRDLFIHGILNGPGGTCSSMPVLVAAVGRRLGYPLKLVEVPGHCFVRWDDPAGKFNGIPERFNIETASHGFVSQPDEHYRQWPKEWSQSEIDCGRYLVSLSAIEEFAAYLVTRGICFEDNGRLGDALQCYIWAQGLAPDDARYKWLVAKTARKYQRQSLTRQERIREIEEAHHKKLRQQASIVAPDSIRLGAIPIAVSPMQLADVGHGPTCACAQCGKERSQRLVARKGDYGHGLSCQCFHCRQCREAVKQQSPGYGRASNQKPFSHW